MEGRCRASIVSDPADQHRVWTAREGGLGATAMVPDKQESWEGWEDSAVPLEKLGDYLRDLKTLMHRYGYASAVYGHFGDGLVHCRINFEIGRANVCTQVTNAHLVCRLLPETSCIQTANTFHIVRA